MNAVVEVGDDRWEKITASDINIGNIVVRIAAMMTTTVSISPLLLCSTTYTCSVERVAIVDFE